ncbi:hypothetical protein BN903_133 [Halorubrum sp. AJ67]|nr:hypothetical protein BN903_133 [Halorubrum sp. AJ67]
MALMLRERAHEVPVVQLLDVGPVDVCILERPQRGLAEQVAACALRVATETGEPDPGDAYVSHTRTMIDDPV